MKQFVFVQTVMCSISYEERVSELEDTSMESTGIPQSTVLHFIALHRYCSFYKTEVLWQPGNKQVYQHHFPSSICSHLGNSYNISKFFIIVFLIVICDQ